MILGDHVQDLIRCLEGISAAEGQAVAWGKELADLFDAGSRLLIVGNGGSAAEAQHLAAEFVGRFSRDRIAYPAVCLASDGPLLTAIQNDYGAENIFARQVQAHARSGDVLLCLSTSGESRNVLAAATAARDLAVTVWAMTGRGPNPLGELADDWIEVTSPKVSTVQEAHLILLHMMCQSFDDVKAAQISPSDG